MLSVSVNTSKPLQTNVETSLHEKENFKWEHLIEKEWIK